MRRGFDCLLLGSRDFLELGSELWMEEREMSMGEERKGREMFCR